MRICIFGAGAVGSHFAVRLALAGHDVCCVMRGPHLEAAKARGLTLRVGDAEFSARVRASDDPATLGPQDLVISTLKANSLGSLVTGLPPLLRENTGIVFAQNGIPWWYDLGLPSDHPPPPDLGFLDPGGRLRAVVSRERIIGGVIFSSNEVIEPGVVKNLSADRNRLLVGECDDRASERIERLRAVLNEASIQSTPVARIREAIWSKLMTNMSMSVLCLIASPALDRRPTTSRRCCRILSAAGRWKSMRWCERRRRLPGPPDCRRRCSICWRGWPSARRGTKGFTRIDLSFFP